MIAYQPIQVGVASEPAVEQGERVQLREAQCEHPYEALLKRDPLKDEPLDVQGPRCDVLKELA